MDFQDNVVGLAGVGSMCNPRTSGGIVQTTETNEFFHATVIAHEMGTILYFDFYIICNSL